MVRLPYLILFFLLLAACNSKEAPKVTKGSSVAAAAPVLADQWHLENIGQRGANGVAATTGEDINLRPILNVCSDNTCRGEGVRVVVIDDGMEASHPELSPNFVTGASWNYLNSSTDPTNSSSDLDSGHGTSVAGIIAAYDSSSTDLRGVASRVDLAAYNALQDLTSLNEADAMTRNYAAVSVSNNSWGPSDGTGRLATSPASWKTAINTGITNGRTNKGIVYLWAAGNGGSASNLDNSNYDGYANYRNVMAVGSVNAHGRRSSYSEKGANLLVSAPGGESCSTLAITTVDRTGKAGINSGAASDLKNSAYTRCMNGTSSATPVVAGVVALMLQANPNLGWRDVRLLLAQSARKNDPTHTDWDVNDAGLNINHDYGFGVVDADAAIVAAIAHVANLPAQVSHSSNLSSPGLAIPDNNSTGVQDSITVAGSGINEIEFVEVVFSATHAYSGDLDIQLESPNGTISRLSQTHTCSGGCVSYSGWVFGSTRHMNESANGSWKLIVKDLDTTVTGTFTSWRLNFYGH